MVTKDPAHDLYEWRHSHKDLGRLENGHHNSVDLKYGKRFVHAMSSALRPRSSDRLGPGTFV